MAERLSETVIDLYRRHGQAWASDRASAKTFIEKQWIKRFAECLPAGGTVLDIGCGSGEPLAGWLIRQGFAVTGVDSAPWMIETCQTRFPDHHWLLADMRQLDLDRTFEGLLAWDSFFHLCRDDQRRMFPLFRKLAMSGSALMFTSGPAAGEAIGTYNGEPLYHASLSGDEYRSLLDANGFDIVTQTNEDPACGGHTVWLARQR